MRVGPEQDLAWPRVALLWQRRMADTRVMRPVLALERTLAGVEHPMAARVIDHVVEITDTLLPDEVAQDVNVAVGLGAAVKM